MAKTNFFYLLGALLFLLLALPLAHDFGFSDKPIMRAVIFSILLLVGSWSLKEGGRYFLWGMLFVVAGIVFSVLVDHRNRIEHNLRLVGTVQFDQHTGIEFGGVAALLANMGCCS